MIPFDVRLRPGESPYKQIVYAATKAVVSGDLLPGSPFPSVRVLSQALKVNPNTAHKVIAELVRSGTLEVLPGVGTVVAEWTPASPKETRQLLSKDVERLLVEAKRLGLSLQDVQEAVGQRWAELFDGPRLESGESQAGSSDVREAG
jgi:GntR family transcriptional regulator